MRSVSVCYFDISLILFSCIRQAQSNLPDSLQLQSSASLGSRNLYTAQDRVDKTSLLTQRKKDRIKQRVASGYHSDDLSDASGHDSQAEQDVDRVLVQPAANPAPSTSKAPAVTAQTNTSTAPVITKTSTPAVGSGLKRSADGQLPIPIVVKRRKIKTAWGRLPRVSAIYPNRAQDTHSHSLVGRVC